MKFLFLVALVLSLVSSELSELQEQDLVKKIDYNLAGIRGIIQGLKRGFYQEYTFEIKPNCFGETTEVMVYNFYEIIDY